MKLCVHMYLLHGYVCGEYNFSLCLGNLLAKVMVGSLVCWRRFTIRFWEVPIIIRSFLEKETVASCNKMLLFYCVRQDERKQVVASCPNPSRESFTLNFYVDVRREMYRIVCYFLVYLNGKLTNLLTFNVVSCQLLNFLAKCMLYEKKYKISYTNYSLPLYFR